MDKKSSTALAGVSSLMLLLAAPNSDGCGQGGSLTITNLPFTPDFTVNLFALNSVGQIGGTFQAPGDFVVHAFIDTAGSVFDPGNFGGAVTTLRGLNNLGQAVGDSQNSDESATLAFLYDGTNILNLGTLGGSSSSATAINNSGVVVGNANLPGDSGQQAFIYSLGVMTSLGDLGGGNSSATAINNNGLIVGNSLDAVSRNRGYVFSGGHMVDLGDLGGGNYTAPFALNDAGLIVGESTASDNNTHAFKYQAGVMTDLGLLGGVSSSASAVNASGQIIGTWTASDSSTHGFIHKAGVTSDLGDLGANYALPRAINSQGQVVGDSMSSDDPFFSHAFLWQNGSMIDMNSLLPTNTTWLLLSAQFINDAGRVVGFGFLGADFTEFVLDLPTGGGSPPVAVISNNNQPVHCGTQVTLDGSQSTSTDGGTLTYSWTENSVVLGTSAILTASFPGGTNLVTLTVTDSCGDSSSANTTVIVIDHGHPTISAPKNITSSTDANCQAVVPDVTGQVSVSDSCTPASLLTITQVPAAGTVVSPGKINIKVTATDPAGNQSSTTVTLTVANTTAPVIIGGPAPMVVAAGDNGNGRVPDVASQIVATDTCTASSDLKITQDPKAGTSLPVGQYTMIITVKDTAGNTTQGSTTFSIVDATAPAIKSVPTSLKAFADSNGHGVVPNVLALVKITDNVTPANQIVVSQNPPAGTVLTKGSYTVVITATDAAGNTATASVPFSVIDKTAPVIQTLTAAPNVLAASGQFVPVTLTVVATDNCDVPSALVSTITNVKVNDNGADYQITGPLSVNLMAANNANGGARNYTITVTTTDTSGNYTSANVTVSVPKVPKN